LSPGPRLNPIDVEAEVHPQHPPTLPSPGLVAALAPPQHPSPSFGAEAGISVVARAGYPATSSAAIALFAADASPASISALPTATNPTFTPGTAERALVTAVMQPPQLMPSIERVIVLSVLIAIFMLEFL
jgi:hypothetical protein